MSGLFSSLFPPLLPFLGNVNFMQGFEVKSVFFLAPQLHLAL